MPGPWFRLAREMGVSADLERTCLVAISEIGLPPDDGLLFVNASAATLIDPDVQDLCLPMASRLVVELTEPEPNESSEELRPALARWPSRGGRPAVDAPGAGPPNPTNALEPRPAFLTAHLTVWHVSPKRPATRRRRQRRISP